MNVTVTQVTQLHSRAAAHTDSTHDIRGGSDATDVARSAAGSETRRLLALLRRHDPARDGALREVGSYRHQGGRTRTVGCLTTSDGTGVVLDVCGRRAIVIDRLTGTDEREPQLRAIAEDYLEEMQSYLSGRRRHHPAPRCPRVSLRTALADTGRRAA